MDGFGILVAVAAFVMAIIALNKNARLESRIAQLKLQLGNLADEIDQRRGPAASPAVAGTLIPEAPIEIVADAPTPTVDEVSAEPQSESPPAAENWQAAPKPTIKPRGGGDMEQALASRWFVWIGGIAIAIGGLLFVKYAYDNGLISPTLQIVLGLIIGAALVAAGEVLRRRGSETLRSEPNYVPAALSAAGLAILFAAIYAAYALYGLVAPATAFIGLAAVGIGSLVLSRWQGPFIAVLGLLGSYATPALIPSEQPSAWGFFPYLFVILAASFATLRGKDWWWLGYGAIAGSAVWGLLWIKGGPFEPGDVWPVGLFAHALALTAFYGLRGKAALVSAGHGDVAAAASDQPLLIGLAGIAAQVVLLGLLLEATGHGVPALVLLAAAMAEMLAIAWARRDLALLAPLSGLLMLIGLMVWDEAAFHAMTLDEGGMWTWSNSFGRDTSRFMGWMLGAGAAFTAVGIAGLLYRRAASPFGALAGGAAFAFVWGAWARTDFLLAEGTWAIVATVFAAGLLAGASAANAQADEPHQNLGAGLLLVGSAGLLILALDRFFDKVWLTLAIAALAAVYAVLSLRLKPWLLGPISVALASLSALRLFVSRELWNNDPGIAWGQHWVLYGYGVPALLFYGASRVLRRSGHQHAATALEGISLGLAMSLVALELRVLIANGIIYEQPRFLEMAAHILTWLAAAYGLMHRQRIFSSFIALWGARILIAMGVAGIVFLSLLALNPVVTEAPVPGNIVLNALFLAYLAPIVLLGLMVRRLGVIGLESLAPAASGLALVLAFAYLTLETKLLFQGKIMLPWSLSVAESYAYSAVWLLFALALFVAGIRLGRQYVRYAGLGVMVLVVLKVFLWDLSSLEGLYRIASFIGLGLCLVGIGWLYQRFVQKPQVLIATGE